MKGYFKFTTKTLVATGLGAAVFLLLFMFVKIPSPIPDTSIQTAYGFGSFMAVLFGPIAGLLIQFIGHALNDTLQYGSPWWGWVIASGISGFLFGFLFKRTGVEEGSLSKGNIIKFNVVQLIANAFAWLLVAPLLDILIYATPANTEFLQGAWAFVFNFISTGIIGSLLLIAYNATRTKKGSLSKKA